MRRVQKIALGYIAGLALVAWGYAIGKYEVFPFGALSQIHDFAYSQQDNTSIVEKLTNDLGIRPERFIRNYALDSTRTYKNLEINGLHERRAKPKLYMSGSAPTGYRIIFGAFDFNETLWGALLLDQKGEVVHQWHLSTDDLPLSTEPDIRKNMYGVNILPDGSIIFLMQEVGGGIVRVDFCSQPIWVLEGLFHHTVTLAEKNKFWTFAGYQGDFDPKLTLVDVANGSVVKTIDMKDVRAANPHIHIFDLQRDENVFDAVHGNDIEPLRAELAQRFSQFETGDLLVSFRITNLVFVLDPDTLKVKWWRVGAWDRQHDPDWNENGRISVFSNTERGGDYSNIISIDPATLEYETLIDGSRYDFYSSVNGMHQVTAYGTILITSSTQGRVFEVNKAGDVVFDFVNLFDQNADKTLHLSNALFLDREYFKFDELPTCEED